MRKFVLLLIAAAVTLSELLTAQVVSLPTITIRLYNNFGIPPRQLKEARRTTDAILENAGLGPAWRECRTAEGPSAKSSDMCEDVLGPGELIVRIVASPTMRNSNNLALGYSH